MKRFRSGAAGAVAVMVWLFAASALHAETVVTYLEGSLDVERAGAVTEGEIGMALAEGDRLRTGPDSLAVVDLEDGGTLKLREETVLVIGGLDDSLSVTLASGGLFSRVRRLAGRSYEVRTPNVVAGVRGTEFFVAYGRAVEDVPDVWLCVNEGRVAVALEDTGESVLVNEGEGINILSGSRITEPKFYPWTQDLNWNVDPSAGSVRDETDLSGAYADLRDFDYD